MQNPAFVEPIPTRVLTDACDVTLMFVISVSHCPYAGTLKDALVRIAPLGTGANHWLDGRDDTVAIRPHYNCAKPWEVHGKPGMWR